MNTKLGAHQSIAGGYAEALKRVAKIGGNCLQVFSSSPRGWNLAKIDNKQTTQFVNLKSVLRIDPVYFHASYLVNLADEGRIGHLSKTSLIAEMTIAPLLKIKGSIVHLGSYKGNQTDFKYKRLITNIKEVLAKTPTDSLFIIENAGNKKIGQTLEEIAQIIKDVDDERVRLCLDTCHLFSNGYRFDNNKELEFFLDKLYKLDEFDRLECWHANDSRDEFDSGHDRHANIGQGKMDVAEFKVLLNHPKTKNYPYIIETPGFKDEGPDKKNLDILKSFVKI